MQPAAARRAPPAAAAAAPARSPALGAWEPPDAPARRAAAGGDRRPLRTPRGAPADPADPDAEPDSDPDLRAEPEPEPDPEPGPRAETRPEFQPGPVGPVDADPRLQPHSEPDPDPDPHPEPDAHSHRAPEPDLSVATEPELEPDPVGPVDTDLRLDLHSDPDLHPEPGADVDRAPEPDLSAEIQPEFEQNPVGPVDTDIRLELHSDPDPQPEPDADAHRAPEPDSSAETHLEFEPGRVGPVDTDLPLHLHSDPDSHPDPRLEPDPHPEPLGKPHADSDSDPEPGTGTGADEPLLELGPLLWPAEPETPPPPPAPREPEDPGPGAGEAELFPAREGAAADPEPASNPCQAQPGPGEADDGPRLRAVFEALDADGDGFVRTEDFVQFATVYGAEQVKGLTRYLDPSGLGVISFHDFFRGITAIRNGDPEGSPALLVPEEETQTCPDEFDDFVTYEATEVTDSAYMGSESTYSECETFTDEDTSTLVQPEIHPEGDADSTGGSAVASECLDGVEELGHGALLLLPGRSLLHSQVAVTVIQGEEHFEDYGEGGDGELSSESLCNGDQACSDPAFLPPSADPLTTKLHGILADEAFEFYCSQCYKQINRLEDLSARLNDLEMNSPTKRLSSKKVARHLLHSGALSMEALQAPPMEPMEDMDEDIADKVIFLEKRVSELERDTVANGEQHSRLRQENLQLVHRANALEEQLKEQELIACEKVLEEARRQRELLCRVEREKSIEVENLQARLQQLDEENSELRSCTPCLKASIQRLGEEKQKLLDEIEELSLRLSEEQENKRRLGDRLSQERHQFQRDKEATQELIEDLRKQLEHLQLFKLEAEQRRGRSNSSGLQHYNSRTRESELEQEVRRLKQDNRSLKEQNDELNGQIITLSIQGAKNLFNTSFSESLAAEISSVSRDELMEAIQKQEEINLRLQDYIDRIIVAIMETNPSILEVK